MKYDMTTDLVDFDGKPILRSPEIKADKDKNTEVQPAEYWNVRYILKEVVAGNKPACQGCGRTKGDVDGAKLVEELQLAMEIHEFDEIELTPKQVTDIQSNLTERFGHIPLLGGQAHWLLDHPGESWYDFIKPKKPKENNGDGESEGNEMSKRMSKRRQSKAEKVEASKKD